MYKIVGRNLMLPVRTTATALKQDTATIINQVYYQNQPIIIERHGKPLVKIIPIKADKSDAAALEKKLNQYFGVIPDLEIPKRVFRKKDLNLESKN